MVKLTPAARLNVNSDTFYLPVPNDGVYFRNNVGTFRMEGEMIDRWIEKLIPVFNGEFTLADLTNGLSAPYRDRVFEIADVLYQNGYIRDVSQDRPHQLSDDILQKYAAQIAFLDSLGDSGAYRFQCYRQTDVLAIGSGPFFVALVASLITSGMPKLNILITDSGLTNRLRLTELAEQARRTDPDVLLNEIKPGKGGADGWREAVQPFQSILYVSQEGNVEELRLLQSVCKAENKVLLPAMCVHQTGMAGPVVHPDSGGCWESAWRRIHQSAIYKDPSLHVFSSTAGAMLANVLVFELFKSVTGESDLRNSFFLLDLETLEGSWHPFLPHPLVHGHEAAKRIEVSKQWFDGSSDRVESNRLLPYLNRLTSEQTGILHIWEEGNLRQLPLSQCRVQSVDPLSEGPAGLLRGLVCSGLTHEEARREAGLTGIEMYVSRLADVLVKTKEIIGFGVGETAAEAVNRGLHANLSEQLARRHRVGKVPVIRVNSNKMEDDECRFYLQSLTTMNSTPVIGLGEEMFGFPMAWVGTGDRWYGSTGLNMTMAFRKALKAALHSVQNVSERIAAQVVEASSVQLGKEDAVDLVIPSSEGVTQSKVLREAIQTLRKNGKQLYIVDLAVEPFLKEEFEGVFGVLLREEMSR